MRGDCGTTNHIRSAPAATAQGGLDGLAGGDVETGRRTSEALSDVDCGTRTVADINRNYVATPTWKT